MILSQGFSIISLVELFYHVTIRLFCKVKREVKHPHSGQGQFSEKNVVRISQVSVR